MHLDTHCKEKSSVNHEVLQIQLIDRINGIESDGFDPQPIKGS